MHLHKEAAISAVAIVQGMGPMSDPSNINWHRTDSGAVEVYAEIAGLAAISAELADRVGNCPDFINDGFPGVYAYEVDEELGGMVGELTAGTDEPIDGPTVRLKLGELALAFFKQINDVPLGAIPLDYPLHETRAIIKELTGYSEPGYVESDSDLVTLRLTMDVTYRRNGVGVSDLQANLDRIPDIAAGEGLLTVGVLDAEVETREHRVGILKVK